MGQPRIPPDRNRDRLTTDEKQLERIVGDGDVLRSGRPRWLLGLGHARPSDVARRAHYIPTTAVDRVGPVFSRAVLADCGRE